MNKVTKKLTALGLTMVFAMMQVSAAIDTELGAGNGGAVINQVNGGYAGFDIGKNSASLKFTGDSHVNWNSLNVNKGQTLNFNAINGAKGITVLNTVNYGMSNIMGNVNANSGISKLIISNPNGVLFDGAKFTTAGDALITTQALNATFGKNPKMEITAAEQPITGTVYIQNSDFTTGGDLSFVGNSIDAVKTAFTANNGKGNIKFTTTNGQDYTVDCCSSDKNPVTALRLEAVQVDGNVFIVADKGIVKTVSGGDISGNLNIKSKGDYAVALNYVSNGETLNVKGDTNIDVNTQRLFIRNAKFDGNLNATNSKGFVEIGNVYVGKDANLTTKNLDNISDKKYNHFVHTIGDNVIKGDLNINSAQNIHIGGYNLDKDNPKIDNGDGTFFYNGKMADGSLTVGGNLNAKTTSGHITTTVNTTAKNINYEANSTTDGNRVYGGNILATKDAVLKADTYQFKANGFIGAIKDSDTMTADNQLINIMEKYQYIPADIASHEYLTIDGGTVTKVETPKISPKGNDVQVYIKSLNNMTLNGANAGVINLTAPGKRIDITGDVHAKEINVGYETDYLKLDFPKRDFTTNYTSIRDEKVVTIGPDEEITYELADGGYNQPTLKPGKKTTYLIGPEKPDVPDKPTPDNPDPKPDDPNPKPDNPNPKPDDPNPKPDNPNPKPDNPNPKPDNPEPVNPKPQPTPEPEKPVKPYDDENARNLMTQWTPEDAMTAPVNTPVAFAADLDDDEEAAAVRKNVDGSVTVVRAFPMYQ